MKTLNFPAGVGVHVTFSARFNENNHFRVYKADYCVEINDASNPSFQ